MQLITDGPRFGVLFLLLLLSGVNAGLRECGEFNEEYLDIFPYQNDLKKIFDAFDENDTQRMEEMIELLGNEGALDLNDGDPTKYKNDPIKYVVRTEKFTNVLPLILKNANKA